jgi:hypothetical protein
MCSNFSMSDDIEQRLAAAAQAAREFEVCGQRCSDLRARLAAAQADATAAQEQYAGEAKDVERLEHLSLTRVLASLHGSRDDALAREQAEAQAAGYRVAEAKARQAAVNDELTAADDRRRQLAGATGAYADALAEKERHLTQSSDPRRTTLLQLAGERGRLTADVGELRDAQQMADAADQALAHVQDRLGSASSWSTYDTYFDGGMIGNAVKHQRMDEAAQAAAEADQRLAALRTELADIGTLEPTAPQLAVSSGLRFTDIFFNNIFTDLAVGHQIRQAQDNVDRSVQLVREVRARLTDRIEQAQQRLEAIAAQREALLTH